MPARVLSSSEVIFLCAPRKITPPPPQPHPFAGFVVRTGHGKSGKSWNFRISYFRPGKSWNLGVGHGKSWKIMFIKKLQNKLGFLCRK